MASCMSGSRLENGVIPLSNLLPVLLVVTFTPSFLRLFNTWFLLASAASLLACAAAFFASKAASFFSSASAAAILAFSCFVK